MHEILVSEEEGHRTVERGAYYVIYPMLPELRATEDVDNPIGHEYSSADDLMTRDNVVDLLKKHKLMVGDRFEYEEDLLA